MSPRKGNEMFSEWLFNTKISKNIWNEHTKKTEYYKMTKTEFDKLQFYQHNFIRSDTKIVGGFKSHIGPNVIGATKGPPLDIMERRYGTMKDRPVIVVPKNMIRFTKNGPKIKDDFIPDDPIIPQYDYQPLHEAIVENALLQGKEIPKNVLDDYPELVKKYGLS